MIRTRLRPLPDLDATYPTLHDHRLYGAGHDIRARTTIALAQWALIDAGGSVVADLSAGTGAIAREVHPNAILGDLAPGHPIQGRIEDTIHDVTGVDVLICTETLEHLDDPDGFLAAARPRCRRIVASLPETTDPNGLDDTGIIPDTNGEHVWQFDRHGGETMFRAAGWLTIAHIAIDPPDGPYRYHLWVLR